MGDDGAQRPPTNVRVRQELTDLVVADLYGPGGDAEHEKREEFTERPIDRYILGRLAPDGAMFDPDAQDSLAEVTPEPGQQAAGAEEATTSDPEAPSAPSMFCSGYGFTARVAPDVTELRAEAQWARYVRARSATGSRELVWQREPHGGTVTIPPGRVRPPGDRPAQRGGGRVDRSGRPRKATRIDTSAVPRYEVPHTDVPTAERDPDLAELAGLVVDMSTLAQLTAQQVHPALDPLVTAYRAWIAGQWQPVGARGEYLDEFAQQAEENLREAERAAARIERAIALLAEDPEALACFRFANAAMRAQRLRTLAAAERRRRESAERSDISADDVAAELDTPQNHTWYPFQLAFILINLEATWGRVPIRIGLWVGGRVTPNRTDDAEAWVRQRRGSQGGGNRSEGSPHQLVSCPWCGSRLEPGTAIDVDPVARRTRIRCPDLECAFSDYASDGEGLPVLLVDEEIYRLAPSLVIATVDKFAQLAWRGETQSLFGRATRKCGRHGYLTGELHHTTCGGTNHHQPKDGHAAADVGDTPPLRPPDLIVQDELHLISGPLGSLVGLYETAVDRLASWKLTDGDERRVRPKVIAFTATVRRAAQQIGCCSPAGRHACSPRRGWTSATPSSRGSATPTRTSGAPTSVSVPTGCASSPRRSGCTWRSWPPRRSCTRSTAETRSPTPT